MKKILLLFVSVGFLFAVNAQTVITPTQVAVEDIASSDFEGVAYSFIQNQSAFDKNFIWERNVIDISDGWTSAVCDNVQCHFEWVNSAQFFLQAQGEGNIDVHAYPNDNEGGAIIEVIVRNATNPNDNATGTYYFNQALSSGERITNKLSIFPNPATDHLVIEEGDKVNRIEFFDISGKLIKEVQSQGSQTIDLSDLPEGSYIVRLWDAQNEALSSNVLIKR
jgi:hypothetical protein